MSHLIDAFARVIFSMGELGILGRRRDIVGMVDTPTYIRKDPSSYEQHCKA